MPQQHSPPYPVEHAMTIQERERAQAVWLSDEYAAAGMRSRCVSYSPYTSAVRHPIHSIQPSTTATCNTYVHPDLWTPITILYTVVGYGRFYLQIHKRHHIKWCTFTFLHSVLQAATIIFQQDGTLPHFSRHVMEVLSAAFTVRWIGRDGSIL
jgi:hypothetical protein